MGNAPTQLFIAYLIFHCVQESLYENKAIMNNDNFQIIIMALNCNMDIIQSP